MPERSTSATDNPDFRRGGQGVSYHYEESADAVDPFAGRAGVASWRRSHARFGVRRDKLKTAAAASDSSAALQAWPAHSQGTPPRSNRGRLRALPPAWHALPRGIGEGSYLVPGLLKGSWGKKVVARGGVPQLTFR